MIDDMMQEFLTSAFGNTKASGGSKFPLTDVFIKDGNVHFDIAVAGFTKDQIKVEVNDEILRIVGEKPRQEPDPTIQYLKKDISERNFDVAYSLRFRVENTTAEIVDGILKIVLTPVSVMKDTRQIEIK
jgi:HSP20 family molecular chaperone IbpA